MTVQVFISYSFDDTDLMKKLRVSLESKGVKCYIAKHDEDYGGSLPDKLTSAIDESNAVVAILTECGSLSATVNQEIGYAKKAKKRIILLLEEGVPQPVLLQGTIHESFTRSNVEKTFNKVSKFIAAKMPQKLARSDNVNLKDMVEQEGIDRPTDNLFISAVLNIGRKYVVWRYGRFDVSLNKEITVLSLIGVGLLLSIFAIIYWSVNTHPVIDSTLLYVGIGLVVPCSLVFSSVEIIRKRKCKKCGKNFGIEMSDSKLVETKEIERTEKLVRIEEIYRNTYTCKFCDHEFKKNESKEITKYLNDSIL